ncbi:MAG: hypothetical protein NTV05_00500 [Acidobacteria bacterium]|nr:hypothetical protein [Acidobacteriota bacterium]
MKGAGVVAVVLSVLTAACASVPVRTPEGPSRLLPASDAAPILAQASSVCRGVRTLTVEIGLSGRVGSRKIRGRVLAGFERSGSLRLEAPAPFGAPVFVLAARAHRATLWFPRDKRVVKDAAVADVLEALTGMPWQADDLLAVLTGCVVSDPQIAATEARRFDSGWVTMILQGGAEAFMRNEERQWRIVGGRTIGGGDPRTASWTVAYDVLTGGFPGRVRVSQSSTTDLTFRVSQFEANVAIDPAAFTLVVPADAQPMSLDELRQMGPLADRTPGGGSR